MNGRVEGQHDPARERPKGKEKDPVAPWAFRVCSR